MRRALLLALLVLGAASARAAETSTVYTRARDAFIAGKDDEVLRLLTPAAVASLRNRSHAALWAALSRARQGQADEAVDGLKTYRAKNKESAFIDRIVAVYTGDAMESEVLALEKEDWQRCEGGFYLGAYRLLFKHDESRGGELLCAAINSRQTSFSEYQMAQALMSQLKNAPPCATTGAQATASAGAAAGGRLSTIERAMAADSLGQRAEAIGLYRAALPEVTDEDRAGLIRSRIYTLTREGLDQSAHDAVQKEDQLSHEAGPENTVAVLRFQNVSDEMTSAPLAKGLPALLSSDLAQVKKLTVLERVEMEALLRELDMSHTEAFDTTQAPRVGHLLRAGRLVLGSFTRDGSRMELESRVLNVKTGKVESRVTKKGLMRDLFAMEKDLALGLLDKLGARPTPAERNRIEKQLPTTKVNAYLAYSKGMDEEDRGHWQNASDAYNSAAQLDPSFKDATAAATLMGRGQVSRTDVVRALRVPGAPAAAASTQKIPSAPISDLLLDRAYDTDRMIGSGLIPDLSKGEANDRRETRPAAAGSGTVIVTGRLP